MNTKTTARKAMDWRDDLERSRDLSPAEIRGFGYLLNWFESWRLARRIGTGEETYRRFWREVVKAKPREDWQLRQWAEAFLWYLRWLELVRRSGGEARSLAERVRDAAEAAGARRGLALRTRRTYGAWVARFAHRAGSAEAVMDEGLASRWLGELVGETKVAFSTQKQALNALVFFFRDVCGREEVRLVVRMRKRRARIPVVPHRSEVMRLVEKLEGIYRRAAMVQYGSGVRLRELVNLRVRDVDLERRTLTVRGGKGDRDCPRLRRRPALWRDAPPHLLGERRLGAWGGG